MICKQCGRENEYNARFCAYCEAELPMQESGLAASKTSDYESDQGFARPDSDYEAPQVLVTGSMADDLFSDKKNGIADQQRITKSDSELHRKRKHQKSSAIRKAKKERKHRQQRLEQELKSRLQESQEALSQYMYQGLNQDVIEEDETKKNKSLRWSILGVIAGLLMTVVILIYMSSRNEKTDYTFITKDAIEVYTSTSEPVSYVFNAQGDMLYKEDGYFLSYYTADHSAAILYDINERNCIYVNNHKRKEFDSVMEAFAMSEDGNFIVYSIPGGLGKYYLRLYDAVSDKDIMIDNQTKHFELLNVLPGGKLISYVTYTMNEKSELQAVQSYLISNNKTPELFGNNLCIYAASADGNDIYYYELQDKSMGSFYERHAGKYSLLSEAVSSKLYFNRDYSQVLIGDNGSYYLSNQGDERRKILEVMITDVLLPIKGAVATRSRAFNTYGIQSFEGKLLLAEDNSVWYLNKDLQSEKIATIKDSMSVTLSEDGNNMIYIDQFNNLVKLSGITERTASKTITEKVTGYKASKDLSQIYFLREDSLYYIENNEEHLISEDVNDLCMNYESEVIIFLKKDQSGTGTLYYSKNGSGPKPVEGGSKVEGIREWNFGVIYQKYVNGTRAVFYNTKGADFQFIMDGINLMEEENTRSQQE